MKRASWFAAAFGVALAAWLIARSGVSDVLGALARVGVLGVAALVLFHLVQLAASAAAWRAIAGPNPTQPGLATYTLLRLVREGVNNLLPSGQIGGEFVAAGLLRRRGVRLADAAAGVICDLTMEMLMQIAFVLAGLALLGVSLSGPNPSLGPNPTLGAGRASVAHAVEAGLGLAVLAAAGFLAAQLLGGAHMVERALGHLSARFGWQGTAELDGLHAALALRWRRHAALLRAAWWHGLSWLLGGLEVWIALRLLGHTTPIVACTVIESIGQALKSAGFAIPGAIGVQEGGYVLVCGLYGLPADTAIALSLLKRLREVVLGAPSLLVWQLLARRPEAARNPGLALGPTR